jgi:Gluconate 2-dehydrogenase subunit 3
VDRREVVKLLAMNSAFPAMPSELFRAFRAIHLGLAPAPQLKILSAHQDATVAALAEMIIPQTETPGARATRVNEFINLIVADWYSDEDRTRFLAGLADLDVRTHALFGKDFVDVSGEQQAAIVRVLGEELAEQLQALAAEPPGYRGEARAPESNFYLMFRELTLTGYFTAEAGATQQLHEEIIPGRFDGCVPDGASTGTKGA